MRVIITGGTGLIGQVLARSLVADRHEVVILSRDPASHQKQTLPGTRLAQWDARTGDGWWELVDGADAIMHLAGENIGGGRWTQARKQRILESRIQGGAAVMDAIRRASVKPRILVQASAVGYYGPHGDERVAEGAAPGHDFQARVVWDWEASTAAAPEMGVRRVVVRTGLAFSTHGGVFPLYTLPFKMVIAGGPLGDGKQYVPWIHIDDHVRAVRFLMESPDSAGPFNVCAPNPVRQKELANALGEVMGRPSFMPAPGFALKIALGEMSELALTGTRQVPQRLLDMGFTFDYPDLVLALRDILTNKK